MRYGLAHGYMRASPMWVSPFRHPRITRYLPFPAAFRSLSRLSSALSAKASALCPFCLTLFPGIALPGSSLFLCSLAPYGAPRCYSLRLMSYLFLYGFFKVHASCQLFPLAHGDGEIRTLDPLLARQVLSQLSYAPFFSFIRQPPALPYRLQYSTIGRLSLNHRVRDGYGCLP